MRKKDIKVADGKPIEGYYLSRGMSLNQFCKKIGIHHITVRKMIEKGVSPKNYVKLLRYDSEFINLLNIKNLDFAMHVQRQLMSEKLMGEELSIFKAKYNIPDLIDSEISINNQDSKSEVNILTSKSLRKIPFVPKYAYASFTHCYDDDEYIEQNEFILSDLPNDGNYAAFELAGDSMDDGSVNSFTAGSRVICRELYTVYWKGIRYKKNPFWVIVHKTKGIFFKQIIAQNENLITCHSLNEIHEDFTIDLLNVNRLYYLKEFRRFN